MLAGWNGEQSPTSRNSTSRQMAAGDTLPNTGHDNMRGGVSMAEVANAETQVPQTNSGPAFHPSRGDGRASDPDGNGSAGRGGVALQSDRSGLPGAVIGGEDDISATLVKLGSVPNFDAGKSLETAKIPAAGKPAGISTGKPALIKQNQAITRTEWFRYELDFRKTQRGFNVTIRKRLKWSNTRYSKQIVKRFCPQLTRKMIDQISVGKFSKETVAALQNGGITDGFIRELQARIGKGNGKRRTDLTDYERSLLARIESGIGAGNRSGSD